MPRKQCKKCPWKVSTDPREIEDYNEAGHRLLERTIKPDLQSLLEPGLRMMACHETKQPKQLPCAGWLMHQLGPGNNIALRMGVSLSKRISADVELDGPQHARFEDTLPRSR
jgi:hypothetical protein